MFEARLLLVHLSQTPGLHRIQGLYSMPGLYSGIYGINIRCFFTAAVTNIVTSDTCNSGEVTCVLVDSDLGDPVDLDELRRNVHLRPSISEIITRLDAALALTPTSVPLTETTILSPKSVCSQSLSQVDSGFGSPPPVFNPDDNEDYDGDISGMEMETDDFRDILEDEAVKSMSRPDGKSRRILCMSLLRGPCCVGAAAFHCHSRYHFRR